MSKHLGSRSRRPRGLLASFAAIVLGLTGLVAVATSASATEDATAPNDCVPSAGQDYIAPTYATEYEFTRTVITQAFVPEVPSTPATYTYRWKKGGGAATQYQWSPTNPGAGWSAYPSVAGQNSQELTPFIAGTPAVPEVTNDETSWSEMTSLDGWTATGNTRLGRVIDPGQPKIDPVVCPVTEWHTWQTSLKEGVITPTGGGHVNWPQAYVGAGQLTPPCGVWYQQDLYEGTSEAIAALYADDQLVILPNGKFEDHALVKDWEFVYGGDCVEEQPGEVTVTPPVFTAPTCAAPGTFEGIETDDYEWTRTGPDTAAVLTATPKGEAVLIEPTEFGPYDLTQLTGERCLSETPLIPETVIPTVVTPAALAETGFPLLGVLGLAGSFSLIGGGLVNARRLLRKSA